MNETQKLIKENIETETREKWHIKVVVEFVDDVYRRVQEIENECCVKFNSAYEAHNLTGTFIPAVNNNPYYIIIKQNRNDMLDVMTAFHEFRHLIDFIQFKKTLFTDDIEQMKKSPLYVTFNVYSEYSATLYGVQQYLKIVRFENVSQNDLAKEYFSQAYSYYKRLEGIKNRYQLLVHSMIYFGNLLACHEFIDDMNIVSVLEEMELYNELKPVFANALEFRNEIDWFKMNDRVMRRFVDGGASN